MLLAGLVDGDTAHKRLLSERPAQVCCGEARAEDVVMAPRGALTPTRDQGVWRTRVETAGGVEVREVRTGLVSRTQAEVKEGLAVGDRVAPVAAARAKP